MFLKPTLMVIPLVGNTKKGRASQLVRNYYSATSQFNNLSILFLLKEQNRTTKDTIRKFFKIDNIKRIDSHLRWNFRHLTGVQSIDQKERIGEIYNKVISQTNFDDYIFLTPNILLFEYLMYYISDVMWDTTWDKVTIPSIGIADKDPSKHLGFDKIKTEMKFTHLDAKANKLDQISLFSTRGYDYERNRVILIRKTYFKQGGFVPGTDFKLHTYGLPENLIKYSDYMHTAHLLGE